MTNKYLKEIDWDDEKAIKELLFGRKVKKVSDDELLLDNGLVLQILPNTGCGGCCAGWYELTELNDCDNAITNIELVEEITSYDCGETDKSYKIFVFAEDKRIKLLQVDGSDGNGYYGTGYTILVKPYARKN